MREKACERGMGEERGEKGPQGSEGDELEMENDGERAYVRASERARNRGKV